MGKKIAKIIFIFIGVVFTFLAYVIAYNSGASTNYFDLLKSSAESENHAEVCKAFSMYNIPYDSKPVAESNKGEKNEIVIYNAINQLNLSYYDTTDSQSKQTNYAEIQYMYYFFIYNPSFSYGAVEGKNETGLRFYDGAGENTFTFHYVVDDNSNKDEIITNPSSPKEALFNTSRNMVTTYSDYGFVFTTISELFVKCVKEELGGTISKFEVLDNKGEVVEGTTINLSFNFTEGFYQDLAEFKQASVDILNMEKIASGDRTSEQNAIYENAQNYLNSFKIEDYTSKGYDKGFGKDDVYTTKLIFSSIGIASLFFLSIAIVYILVFYFTRIKNWVFGGRHSRTTQRIVPNKINNAPTYSEPRKTNLDRVNEKRAEDLAKKKAREEEIRKNGNVILAPKPVEEKQPEVQQSETIEAEEVKTEIVEEVKIEDAQVEDAVSTDSNIEEVNNNENKED